jgi:cell division transport system ATP-binding protein
VIRLEEVSKVYKTSTRPALERVSVNIEKGEFVFLIGPSGSGKSTFLRLLLREETPSKGRVMVSNFDVVKLARRRVPRLRQTIGCARRTGSPTSSPVVSSSAWRSRARS